MSQIITQIAAKQSDKQDGYGKGQNFEQFVIKLFNEHFFYLKKWRKSEKSINTCLSVDHFNPDLEMELVFTGSKKYRFAVECK